MSAEWIGYMPDVEREDGNGDWTPYGRWVESDGDTYWTHVYAKPEGQGVYATCTRPGDLIMTSWHVNGVPTVGAVDVWLGGTKQPTEFYVFDPMAGSTEA